MVQFGCPPTISLAFILLGNGSVWSWGKVGHQTVAYIAEKNLKPGVMDRIKPLLAGGKPPANGVFRSLFA